MSKKPTQKLQKCNPTTNAFIPFLDTWEKTQKNCLVIRDQEHLFQCGNLLKTVHSERKSLFNHLEETMRPLNEAKSEVLRILKPKLHKYQDAERTLKAAILKYQLDQKRKRSKKQRKAVSA